MDSNIDNSLDLFTGREEYIRLFKETIGSEQPEKNILQFYGIAGMGKTALRRKLTEMLQKEYEKKVCFVELDFAHSNIRSMEDALMSMSSNFMTRYNIAFPFFSMAYEEFLRKKFPLEAQNIMKKQKEQEFGIIEKHVDLIEQMVPFLKPLVNVAKLYYVGKDHIGKELTNEKRQVKKYNDFQLYEKLPEYFIKDLNVFANNDRDQKKIVFFFDTYEAIKRPTSHHKDSEFVYEDRWIRQIAENVQNGISVLLGREQITWNGDKKLRTKIIIKPLQRLNKEETRNFLIKSGIKNKEIREIIAEKFEGYPLFITLAIEIYKRNIDKKELKSEDFIFDKPEDLMERFLSHLSPYEREALKIMSVARYWDSALLGTLIREFCPAYPFSTLHKFKNYSFIQPTSEPGSYYIHEQVKDLLKVGTDPEFISSINYFLYKYFKDKSIPETSFNLSLHHKNHLEAAVYYGASSGKIEETVDWLSENYDIFRRTPFHDNIVSITEDIYYILKNSNKAKLAKQLSLSKCESMLGYLYLSAGNNEIARILLESAYKTQKEVLGLHDYEFLLTMKHLGFLYREIGEYINGIKILKNVLSMIIKEDEEKYLKLKILCLEELAMCYGPSEGNYRKVLSIYESSLDPAKQVNDESYISKVLQNMGNILTILGEFEKSRDHLKEAFKIRKKILHPQHHYILCTQQNLASANRELGYLDDSLISMENILEKRRESLSPENRSFIITQEELALTYIEIGYYTKALKIIEQTKKKRKQIFSVFIYRSYYQLLKIKSILGDWIDIESINNELEKDIKKRNFHPDHPRILYYKGTLSKILLDQECIGEAANLFQYVLEKRIKLLGYKNPITAETLDDYSDYYLRIKEYDKAELLLLDVIRIRRETLGQEHYKIGKSLNKLALIYIITGKYPKAEKCLTESLDLLKKAFDKFGQDNINLAPTYHNLGLLFLKTGKYEESEFNLNKALSIRRDKFSGSHPDIARNLLTLSSLYSQTDRKDKSEETNNVAVSMIRDYCKSDEGVFEDIKQNYKDVYC